MKKYILIMMLLVVCGSAGFFRVPAARAGSLYEYYADAKVEQLQQETTAMGKKLKKTFSQENISRNQQKIDFASYFANLKKAVRYAGKLATYSQYREDLAFARDNDLFKGLPEEPAADDSPRAHQEHREFVEQKYERTKRNVEEEIETYVDLLNLALDNCESMSANDLSGFLDQEGNRRKVKKWLNSEEYQAYQRRAAELGRSWPEIGKRIASQCALWQGRPPRPDAPIISAGLVDKL